MSTLLTVRSPSDADYDAISHCITEARGKCYYSKEYYDPVYLLNSGKHELFAAYDENGDMLGFIGLSYGRFHDSRTMLSLLNIRPCRTGNGAATLLLTYCVNLLRERGEKAVKGNAVTSHISIQKVLESLGLKPTGILPGVRDANNSNSAVSGKRTLTVHVCPLASDSAGTLFFHHNIAEFGKSIYSSLGIHSEIITNAGKFGSTLFEYQYDPHDNVLFIQLIDCGIGVSEEIRELLKQYTLPSMTAVILLNLAVSSAIYAYESLCADGWRFCGLDPLGRYENAVFFKGNATLSDLKLSERTTLIYEKLHL